MDGDNSYFVGGGIDSASVENSDDSSLRAIDADADENISGENVTSNGDKIANS